MKWPYDMAWCLINVFERALTPTVFLAQSAAEQGNEDHAPGEIAPGEIVALIMHRTCPRLQRIHLLSYYLLYLCWQWASSQSTWMQARSNNLIPVLSKWFKLSSPGKLTAVMPALRLANKMMTITFILNLLIQRWKCYLYIPLAAKKWLRFMSSYLNL